MDTQIQVHSVINFNEMKKQARAEMQMLVKYSNVRKEKYYSAVIWQISFYFSIFFPPTSSSNYASKLGYSLVDFMSAKNMMQLNAIRNSHHKTLDLIFSNCYGGSVSECKNTLSKVDLYHPSLDISINHISPALLKSIREAKFNFKRANYTLINKIIIIRETRMVKNIL